MGCKYTICAFNCSLLLLPLNKLCKEQREIVPMHPVALPTHAWGLFCARALHSVILSFSFFQFEDVARCQKQRDDLDIFAMVELENLAMFIFVVM
jgi:hypothetical protein